MSENIEVTVSHRFKASAERVYDAWLDPDKVRVQMSTALQSMGLSGEIVQIEIDARIGGAFLFSDMRDGIEAKHWGTYLELERPRKIVFTWITAESEDLDPSIVSLTIEPDGEGCIATIVHEMDARWADFREQAVNGWSCILQAMDRLLDN